MNLEAVMMRRDGTSDGWIEDIPSDNKIKAIRDGKAATITNL
jgi:hypothetical protein